MGFHLSNLLHDALRLPQDAAVHTIGRELRAAFPSRYILQSDDGSFDVDAFKRAGNCTLTPQEGFPGEYEYNFHSWYPAPWENGRNTWETVVWEGQTMEMVKLSQTGEHCNTITRFLIAPTEEVARSFFMAVGQWYHEVRGEVLVFSGSWYKDEELFDSIQNSTLDNLVLESGLKEGIANDFLNFFKARETYERYGIPWKRGVLLLGPPGNGKTHTIKALVNLLKVPCLYVRTFKQRYGTDFESIQSVFRRARETAPCLVVFEDLDSIVTDNNRSFFLNELDGFAANTGLMIVATTNHPERLDPAILDRPSRFDRKYTFRLPDEERRAEYLGRFGAEMEPALRLDEETRRRLAERTDGFSFVYLRELYLSSMMAWISAEVPRPFGEVIHEQVETLRLQMSTAKEEMPSLPMNPEYDDSDD